MKLSPAILVSMLLGASALAQNHAPVVAKLPDLTVPPGAAPLTFYLQNNISDPDLSDYHGTQVRFVTTLGTMNIELFDAQTPITVQNFLNYVNAGKFNNLMWHRTAPGFVIQSGGYTYPPATTSSVSPTAVVTLPAIQNEPGISNTRGTVAMARISGQVNSATSQWYVNLANNGGAPANLDTIDQGFTVFGRVIEGDMATVDALAAVKIYNLTGLPKFDVFPGVFTNLPLRNYTIKNPPNPIKGSNVLFVTSATVGPKMVISAVSDNPTIADVTLVGNSPALTGDRLTITPGNPGTATVTVKATDFNGLVGTSVSTVTVGSNPPTGKLRNISTRGKVQTGESVMIGGFIIQGTGTKRLLVRVLGSELTQYGVPNVLADPYIELRDSNGNLIASNNTWTQQTNPADVAAIQATPYAPADPQEPALLQTLGAGEYTVIVYGTAGTTGNALVEVYELDAGDTARLANISTRGGVGTSDDVMIGGFIVNGTTPKRVIVRAIGPSLAPYGIQNPLLDPKLEIYAGSQLIAQNDNWQLAPGGGANPDQAAIVASGRAPNSDQESAVILTLAPGSYTAIVRGANNTTGVALVEVYDLD